MHKQTWLAVWLSLRPNFLLLTPLCVMTGALYSSQPASELISIELGLVLVGALSAHASVNWLNEYFDFQSGLDLHTVRTPFSGGSGALPQIPAAAKTVWYAGIASFVLTAVIGLFFLIQLYQVQSAWLLLCLGLLGLTLVWAYTQYLTRKPWLCLLAPGLGFGPAMVIGSHLALGGNLNLELLWLSLPALFLVSNLLLINQLPDIEADMAVGRNHLPIAIGKQGCAKLYGGLLITTYLTIAVGIIAGQSPWFALVFITAPLAANIAVNLYQKAEQGGDALIPLLAKNVALVLSSLVLLDVAVFVAG